MKKILAPQETVFGQTLSFIEPKFHGLKMDPLTLASARAMRDGGIDAMAALNTALSHALVGISLENSVELKRTFGNVMGEVVSEIINPAVRAFPELAVDESAWSAIARAQAGARYNRDSKVEC